MEKVLEEAKNNFLNNERIYLNMHVEIKMLLGYMMMMKI